jgi:hypothetical protein
MDETKHSTEEAPRGGVPMSRRSFFTRTALAAGAAATLLTLTGCPGGDQDDDGDDEDDD